MSEAPERIWVSDTPWDTVEYVRADLHEELEAKLTKALAWVIYGGPMNITPEHEEFLSHISKEDGSEDSQC